MKVHFSALAAAALITMLGSSAMAAQAVTAKLQTPIEGVKKPVAGEAVFVCQADTCTAGNPTGQTLSTSGCRQLVRAVGAVSSYGNETRQLEAAKLASCNGSAKK